MGEADTRFRWVAHNGERVLQEYKEALHPRGRGGKWVDVLGKLGGTGDLPHTRGHSSGDDADLPYTVGYAQLDSQGRRMAADRARRTAEMSRARRPTPPRTTAGPGYVGRGSAGPRPSGHVWYDPGEDSDLPHTTGRGMWLPIDHPSAGPHLADWGAAKKASGK